MPLPPTVMGELQFPDLRRLDQMPSWPAWVASRIALLTDEDQRDLLTGRYRRVPTLPEAQMMTQDQRSQLSQHVLALRTLCSRTPERDPDALPEMMRVLSKIMIRLPASQQNELGVEVRGEAYVDAVEDLPPWAVDAAVRCWNRGDCGLDARGQPYDYRWVPAPAELRRISRAQLYRVEQRAETLERLVQAQPRVEFSDEHRRSMAERLAQLARHLAIPLVGKDGSGGTVGATPTNGAHCGTQPKARPGLKREGGCRRRGDRRK